MRRTAAAIYLLAVFTLLLAGLMGCAVTEPYERPNSHSSETNPLEPISEQAIVRRPLTMITKRLNTADCAVRYPYVCDEGMDILNISIHMAFTDFANECEAEGGRITYTVEFNRYGLLSLLLTCSTGDGKTLFTNAANFDTDTGKRVYLSDCFGKDAQGIPERLTELLWAEAERLGTAPIGDLPAFDDSTLFYFTYGGLYLIFREYEVFPPEAGTVRIKAPYAALEGQIGSDGLLNRLK